MNFSETKELLENNERFSIIKLYTALPCFITPQVADRIMVPVSSPSVAELSARNSLSKPTLFCPLHSVLFLMWLLQYTRPDALHCALSLCCFSFPNSFSSLPSMYLTHIQDSVVKSPSPSALRALPVPRHGLLSGVLNLWGPSLILVLGPTV